MKKPRPDRRRTPMPRKRKDQKDEPLRQVNIRLPVSFYARIERAARVFNIEPTALIRLMLSRSLPAIEREVDELSPPD